MKKILTFLLAAGSFVAVSAQPKAHKPVNNSNSIAYNAYSRNAKEMAFQVQKVNREFDQKIASVKRNPFMRSAKKAKEIRQLEWQRNVTIRAIEERYAANSRGHSKNDSHRW